MESIGDKEISLYILIDNSDTSINSDFQPNRLEAQKKTVETLFQDYISSNYRSVKFGIETMGEKNFGIQLMPTQSQEEINKYLESINIGGKLLLRKALHVSLTSIVKFHHPSIDSHNDYKILVFIGGRNDFTERDAEFFITKLQEYNIKIEIVVFGADVDNIDILSYMCRQIPNSKFLNVPNTDTILSDEVLSSNLREGRNPRDINPENYKHQNPQFKEALRKSQRKRGKRSKTNP